MFLEVLREAKAAEIEMKQAYFSETENSSPKTFLYSYLVAVKQMFEENQSLKFWLRMSFFPPSHLYETILDEVLEVEVLQENMLEQSFRKWLDEDLITGPDARSLTIAYTGILMSIMVELVYDHTEKSRRKARGLLEDLLAGIGQERGNRLKKRPSLFYFIASASTVSIKAST